MHRIRVLLLATDLQRGGLPLRLVRLARRFHEVAVEPVVGCLAARGPLNDLLDSDGIATFACGATGRFDIRCLGRLASEIRRFNPDLIHASLFHANLAARLVGRLDRTRPVITSTVTIEMERRWHRAIESLSCSLSDLHIANSQAVADHLRLDLGFPSQQIVVVPNAVDFDAMDRVAPVPKSSLGVPENAALIVWAGRMDPVKNLEVWIDVVTTLATEAPVHGLLLGDGPERPRIRALIENRRASQCITLAGWREDVAGVLKSADLFLFPSRTEGSPNALLEALCCGCPVVTGDAPACAELIRAAGTGRLCHHDDTQTFIEHARHLLADRETARREAQAAARTLRARHNFTAVLAAWRAVYDRFLNRHQVCEISRD